MYYACLAVKSNQNKSDEGASGEWLMDYGATCHLTPYDDLVINPTATEQRNTVANGSHSEVNKKRDVIMTMTNGDSVKITDVLVAPGFDRNVLSTSKLIRKGCNISSDEKEMVLETKANGGIKLRDLNKKRFQRLPPSGQQGQVKYICGHIRSIQRKSRRKQNLGTCG